MRRKPGTLLPLEADILAAGLELRSGGAPWFHGFQLAKELADNSGAATPPDSGEDEQARRSDHDPACDAAGIAFPRDAHRQHDFEGSDESGQHEPPVVRELPQHGSSFPFERRSPCCRNLSLPPAEIRWHPCNQAPQDRQCDHRHGSSQLPPVRALLPQVRFEFAATSGRDVGRQAAGVYRGPAQDELGGAVAGGHRFTSA
ncbi:MAG: hypothetical protein M3252_02045, partial [Actinomycetota bacterium]|nr:hypothetical protein [Actinomycetota bacterium]